MFEADNIARFRVPSSTKLGCPWRRCEGYPIWPDEGVNKSLFEEKKEVREEEKYPHTIRIPTDVGRQGQ